jgi:uncharacterized protein (UPF0276 family)
MSKSPARSRKKRTAQDQTKKECRGSVGIGLRACHLPEFLATRPAVDWVEVTPENYLCSDVGLRALALVRRDYELSLHCVGLSLGSADGVQPDHLACLAALTSQLEPALVSDHLSWSTWGGIFFDTLLPMPYTREALGIVSRNIEAVQRKLRRRILIENVASYVRFRHSQMSEPEFLMEVARRTGCGVLCDLTNIFVTWRNFGLEPIAYVRSLGRAAVAAFHLGGHSRIRTRDGWLLFDDHAARVDPAVWSLYRQAVRWFGPRPTFIERDADLPSLKELIGESRHARQIMSNCNRGDWDEAG